MEALSEVCLSSLHILFIYLYLFKKVVTALILFIGCQNEHVLRSNKQHMTVSLTSQNNEIINISFKGTYCHLGYSEKDVTIPH